jgi:short-subunit dehydrogenase
VLVVSPGRVRTRFHVNAFRHGKKLPGVFERRETSGVPPEEVARVTLRALRRGKREAVIPWSHRLLVGLRTLFPALFEGVLGHWVRPPSSRTPS